MGVLCSSQAEGIFDVIFYFPCHRAHHTRAEVQHGAADKEKYAEARQVLQPRGRMEMANGVRMLDPRS